MAKYKTFTNLMASVESDLSTHADEGFIDRSKMIKEVRKVNAELGLRINSEKEDILEVSNYKAKLPFDFQFLQLALACEVKFFQLPSLRGIQTEQITVDRDVPLDQTITDPCKNICSFDSCGDVTWVSQKVGERTFKFQSLKKISLTKRSHPFCADNCLNLIFNSPDQMEIKEDDASFSFREGKVYINYLTDMVDYDGNLLVLDHPLVSDFYEYTIKRKILENLELNKEGDFARDYQLVTERWREARIQALSFINTPEYGEIQSLYKANRHRFYKRYVSHFDETKNGIFKA